MDIPAVQDAIFDLPIRHFMRSLNTQILRLYSAS